MNLPLRELAIVVLAFLSALVAIRGKTWNKKGQGWKRLTLTGWIASALAVGTVAVATWNVVARESEVARVRRVAHSALHLGVNQLVEPLRLLSLTLSRTNNLEVPRGNLREQVAWIVEAKSHPRIDSPVMHSPTAEMNSWRNCFRQSSVRAKAVFDSVLAAYTNYLDPAIVETLGQVQTSSYLTATLQTQRRKGFYSRAGPTTTYGELKSWGVEQVAPLIDSLRNLLGNSPGKTAAVSFNNLSVTDVCIYPSH